MQFYGGGEGRGGGSAWDYKLFSKMPEKYFVLRLISKIKSLTGNIFSIKVGIILCKNTFTGMLVFVYTVKYRCVEH